MPRKWENSKGVNVFNEKAIDRSLKYLKKELGLKEERKDYKKPYKPYVKKKGVK